MGYRGKITFGVYAVSFSAAVATIFTGGEMWVFVAMLYMVCSSVIYFSLSEKETDRENKVDKLVAKVASTKIKYISSKRREWTNEQAEASYRAVKKLAGYKGTFEEFLNKNGITIMGGKDVVYGKDDKGLTK